MSALQTPTPSSVNEKNLKDNRHFWARYDWPRGGDEWSSAFGGTRAMWELIIRPRITQFVPTRSILEIAPGHGRVTQFLLGLCDRLTIVDLVPECIEACRRRFANRPGLTFAVNDGKTLPMVPDASIDFAISWDSLVHVERDTMTSYVRELGRVLAPGGGAFIHHSNLGAYAGQIGELHERLDLHGRGTTMSAAALRMDCAQAGLRCEVQELIPWGTTGLFIDTFSLIRRSSPGDPPTETVINEHAAWPHETALARRLGPLRFAGA
jgi:SAM-dependent methyltransferase